MPLLSVGFRPFFLVGTAFAALAMAAWVSLLSGLRLPILGLGATSWHGHEMVFGFSMAIVAGFLLTATANWTGKPTATGAPLAGLVLLWAVARGMVTLGGPGMLPVAALFDGAFGLGLIVAVARPIIEVRQTRQAGIVSKLVLLLGCQALFYGGAAGWIDGGQRLGVEMGLYLVLALILTIASRVMPFFIRSALPDAELVASPKWLDRSALALFLGLCIVDVFTPWGGLAAGLAAVLVALHLRRLWGWWTPAVLSRSLLWVLFLAYSWIIVGFALQAAAPFTGFARLVPLHAHAAGGIGVITLGMIARVSLGHTGRDVRSQRVFLGGLFLLGFAAAALRVFGPLIAPGQALDVWRVSGATWALSFAALACWGLPIWLLPRPDAVQSS